MSKISYQYEPVDYMMSNIQYLKSSNQSNHSNNNIMMIIDEEEQEKRNHLIQQATNRLRQKILEKKYETLMSQIVEIQSKLEIIKLETTISFKSIDSNHLLHFEKRLENHKFDLENIIEKEEEEISSYSSYSSIVENKEDSSILSEIGRNELIVLHSIHHDSNNGLIKNTTRNALDDTLSFLNDLASDTDDGGFRKDIIELLKNNQNNTNIPHKQLSNPFSWLLSISWKWIRFALIMILAILINIKQGPSLF